MVTWSPTLLACVPMPHTPGNIVRKWPPNQRGKTKLWNNWLSFFFHFLFYLLAENVRQNIRMLSSEIAGSLTKLKVEDQLPFLCIEFIVTGSMLLFYNILKNNTLLYYLLTLNKLKIKIKNLSPISHKRIYCSGINLTKKSNILYIED